MPRIQLNDNMYNIAAKMSEGNPGALGVICQLIKNEAQIDLDSGLAPLGTILCLDDLQIYGPGIWVLYKDVCDQSIVKLIALTRGYQLGFINREKLQGLSDRYNPELEELKIGLDEVFNSVKERLPNFKFDYQIEV